MPGVDVKNLFCDSFKAGVSDHFAECETCRKSLTSAMTFLKTEIPFLGFIAKRYGIDIDNLLQSFLKGEKHG